jgi:hypothetical protein
VLFVGGVEIAILALVIQCRHEGSAAPGYWRLWHTRSLMIGLDPTRSLRTSDVDVVSFENQPIGRIWEMAP